MRTKKQELRTRILRCLANAGGTLWVREIGRRTGIPHTTVSRILDDFYTAGLTIDHDLTRDTKGKLKIRLVRLKPNVKVNYHRLKTVASEVAY